MAKRQHDDLLIEAVHFGEEDEVIRLIESGDIDLNAISSDGKTPWYEWILRWAFEEYNQEVAKAVIENGDADKINALYCGKEDTHRYIDEWGEYSDSDEEDFPTFAGKKESKTGNTLLHMACQSGFLMVAESLIKIGADIHAKNKKGMTPLQQACKYDMPKIVKLLVENGAHVNSEGKNGWTKYCHICEGSHLSGYFDGWVLCWACDGGHLEVVKLLMDGNDFNAKYAKGETALRWTICFNCPGKIDKANLEDGILKAYEIHEHMRFVQDCRFKVVKFLVQNGADLNGEKKPLKWVCKNSRNLDKDQLLEMIKLLVENGADPNIKNKYNVSPLHLVCNHANGFQLCKLLVEKGADVTSESTSGVTPLHLACKKGNLDIVQFLVRRGANVSAKTAKGDIPMSIAGSRSHSEIVWFLVRQQPDLVYE